MEMDLAILYNVIYHKHIKGEQVHEKHNKILGGCQMVFSISYDIQEIFACVQTCSQFRVE